MASPEDLNAPSPEALSSEQEASLSAFREGFDPALAEKEYRAMLQHGGIPWEQLLSELEAIDRHLQQRSA
jgi:hypothetical protein